MRATSQYRVRGAANVPGVVFFGFVALLEIPSLWSPGKGGAISIVMAALIVAACFALTIRSFRSGLQISSNEVICRDLLRTTRWPRSTVTRFEPRPGRHGAVGYRRLLLWIIFTGGNEKRLGLVNWSPKSEIKATLIVSDLNRALDS